MMELALPNAHALAVMILIVVALVLFTREKIPLQTTSLLVLATLLGVAAPGTPSDRRNGYLLAERAWVEDSPLRRHVRVRPRGHPRRARPCLAAG